MKIKIDHYEVNITAKREGEEKNSKDATLALLNYIAIQFSEANRQYKRIGLNALARKSEKEYNNLTELLEKNKYFDKIDIPF